MKLGRNDPCHCGSGKKYKKCCLEKDEAASQAQQEQTFEYDDDFDDDDEEDDDDMSSQPAASSPSPLSESEDEDKTNLDLFDDDDYDNEDDEEDEEDDADAPELDDEAAKQRWKDFEKQDYEGKLALFVKTLEEPKLMDDEMAFSMLDTLHQETSQHNARDRYDALVEQLRERLPKVYAKSAHFYLENRINNAVIAGRFEHIPAFVKELAERAGKDIDTFNNVVNQLAYHGQLPTLIDAVQIAWPKVNHSGDIVPWGIDEFTDQAAQFLVFDYIERHPAATAGDAELFERLKLYGQIEVERISKFIALLSGQPGREWTRKDFTVKPRKHQSHYGEEDDNGIKIPKQVRQNLFDISLEFQGHLRREQNVPFTKSELGRAQIVKYFVDRLASKLEPRLSMLEAAMNKPKPKTRRPEFYLAGEENSVNWLCPDRDTFDHFLSELFHFLNPQPYSAVVTFEIMPFWLRFLETRQLLSVSLRERTLHELRKLNTDLLKLMHKMSADTALHAALEHWAENAQVKTSS